MIGGYRVTQMIRSAAELGVCDGLGSGSVAGGDLAAHIQAEPALLMRLLRALCAFGILAEDEDGRFSNTDLGHLLRSDVPGSLRNAAMGLAEDAWWQAWGRFPTGVREGGQPFQLAHGRTFWQLAEEEPGVKARFNGFMAAQTTAFIPQLLEAFDFAACKRIVDVGGGNGALAAGILRANPATRATVFDLAAGLEGADAFLVGQGVRDRCDLMAGSFFDAIPVGADVYLMRLVLHDWDDAGAAAILATCRRAMQPGARLLVMDHLLPVRVRDQLADRQSLALDLHMYVLFGARERTETELRGMLTDAGFAIENVAPTSPTAIIVARAL